MKTTTASAATEAGGLNSFTGGKVRWLDDDTIGDATPERDSKGLWLGTFTVLTPNLTTGGKRCDVGAILGMHIVAVSE